MGYRHPGYVTGGTFEAYHRSAVDSIKAGDPVPYAIEG